VNRLFIAVLMGCGLFPFACTTHVTRVQSASVETMADSKATLSAPEMNSAKTENTDAFFYPKIELNELRFGFRLRGKVCFNMRDDVDYDQFEAETGFSESGFSYDLGDLSKVQEEWLLRRSTDAVHPSWAVFNPMTYQTEMLPFQGITWAGGETASFVCLLGKNRRLSEWEHAKDSRTAKVLAFPCPSNVYAHPMHARETDVHTLGQIRELIAAQCPGAILEECYKVYVHYPFETAHLTTYNAEGNRILALIYSANGHYRMSALLQKRGEARFGGMLIEHADPNYDTALKDTHIAILPDLDGNGANEIYIDSTVCFLLSIRTGEVNQPILEETNSYYAGP